MPIFNKKFMRILLAAVMWCAAGNSFSAVTSVQGIPASQAIQPDSANVFLITWSVTVALPVGSSAPTVSATVQSPLSQVVAEGSVIATVGGRQIQEVNGTPGEIIVVNFNEKVVLSSAVSARIGAAGQASLQRDFGDGAQAVTGVVNLLADSSTAPGLIIVPPATGGAGITPVLNTTEATSTTVRAMELYYDDETTFRTIASHGRLKASAHISYSGGGVLSGVWEIAEPLSISRGAPLFFPLRQVRKNLVGQGKVVIESPLLPTRFLGTHRLRFSIRAIDGILADELKYAVIPTDSRQQIHLETPGSHDEVGANTLFRWKLTDSGERLRLEFFDIDTHGLRMASPIAGVEMNAGTRSVRLRPFTLERLQRMGARSWRVVAIDRRGVITAASPFRVMEKP